MPELLTDAEHEVIDLLGQAWTVICEQVVAAEASAGEDLREIMHHLHAVQNAVLANAAARAYPEKYRLMGADHP